MCSNPNCQNTDLHPIGSVCPSCGMQILDVPKREQQRIFSLKESRVNRAELKIERATELAFV